MTTIAGAGGTGVLGSEVVDAVRRRDLSARSIARSQGIDLTTGEGLDETDAGVDADVDASNVVALRAKPAVAFALAGLLVDVALGEPSGLVPDVAGPEQALVPDLARRLVARRGRPKVLGVPLPGRAGRQIADGGLLPGKRGRSWTRPTTTGWRAPPADGAQRTQR